MIREYIIYTDEFTAGVGILFPGRTHKRLSFGSSTDV